MSSAPKDSTPEIETFITRWAKAEASERANYQMFLAELADLLDVPHPDPAGADNAFNQYVFDGAITHQKPDGSSTTVWADLYKRGCFILETKQGAYKVEAASSRLPDSPSAIQPPTLNHSLPRGRSLYAALLSTTGPDANAIAPPLRQTHQKAPLRNRPNPHHA